MNFSGGNKKNKFDNIIDNIKSTYIKESCVHGFGLFASESIEANQCLGMLDGQYISWDLYQELSKSLMDNNVEATLFMEWNAIHKDLLLTRPFRTKYSYINHSRIPNVKIETSPLRVVTMRKIEKDEELLLDYRKEELNDEYLSGHGKTYL